MVSPTSSVLFPFPREALTGSGTSYEFWAGFVDDLGADAWGSWERWGGGARTRAGSSTFLPCPVVDFWP